jgi:DNA repair photolyase
MSVEEVTCKTALSVSRLPDLDYALNPYTGCRHGCLYCYVPAVMQLDRDRWGTWVQAKTNIPSVLERELRRKARGVVGIATVTDAYQPAEETYRLTRRCLEALATRDWPVDVLTKSTLVTRDIDLLRRFSGAKVGLTIPALDDRLRRVLEPRASSIENRFAAVRTCADADIPTYVFCGPLYPTTEQGDVTAYVDACVSAGAREIVFDTLHMKPGLAAHLKTHLPADLRDAFLARTVPAYYERMYRTFADACHGKITLLHAF